MNNDTFQILIALFAVAFLFYSAYRLNKASKESENLK